MRVTNKADLERLTKGGELGQSGISSWASRQIERALAESSGSKVPRERRPESTAGGKGAPKKRARQVVGESPGEAAVRLALISAFGDWHKGGEVVAELMPFRTRRFRTDHSLPRWRIAWKSMDGPAMASICRITFPIVSGDYFLPAMTGSPSASLTARQSIIQACWWMPLPMP